MVNKPVARSAGQGFFCNMDSGKEICDKEYPDFYVVSDRLPS